MKPTKKQIQKWVLALRSGEYSQTKGTLQDEQGYCCLGVACDIFIPKGLKTVYPTTGLMIGVLPYAQSAAPKWLSQIERILETCIPALNDYGNITIDKKPHEQHEPFTFDEIADLLEYEYIEGVEV